MGKNYCSFLQEMVSRSVVLRIQLDGSWTRLNFRKNERQRFARGKSNLLSEE